MKMNPMPSGGCPFLFSGSVWESKKVPIKFPNFYWHVGNTKLAFSIHIITIVFMNVPIALLSDAGYSRYTLGGGMLLLAAYNLILYTFHTMGDVLFLAVNIINGFVWSLIFPTVFTLISQWSLPSHRIFYTIIVLGDFCALNITRFLLNFFYISLKTWRTGHIVACISALIWLGFGFIFVHHSPNESPLIRQHGTNIRRRFPITLKRLQDTPWRKIGTSLPFLSLILAWVTVDFIFWVNIFATERYQEYILHLPVRFSNNFYTMQLYVAPSAVMGGLLADWIIRHRILSSTAVKRTYACIGLSVALFLQFALPFVGCNIVIFWIISISSVFFIGLTLPVICSNTVDLSPRHAGLLMAIIDSVEVLCFKLSDEMELKLNVENYNWDEWRNFFILYCIVSFALVIPFIFFGSGEAQAWDHSRRTRLHTAASLSLEH